MDAVSDGSGFHDLPIACSKSAADRRRPVALAGVEMPSGRRENVSSAAIAGIRTVEKLRLRSEKETPCFGLPNSFGVTATFCSKS